MKVALIGPPFSGKTTLLTAVCGSAPAHHIAGEPHQATVKIPDNRLAWLAERYNPKKVVPATIDFVDVPGLCYSDHRGREELRKHLGAIRQAEVLVAVVRAFKNETVPPYRERINALADLVELHDEFAFSDLEGVTNRIDKLEKAITKAGKHDQERKELALMQHCREALESEKPLSSAVHGEEDSRMLRSFGFLTEKPLIVAVNISESDIGKPPPFSFDHAYGLLPICAATEADIAQMEPDDKATFLKELGIESPAHDLLIAQSYQAAGLISFLTAGPEEVRAWPVLRDSSAVEAAGKIHSDIARGFIRAETVSFEDLQAAGDIKTARANGKVRQEGKTYIVQDGDVILFKFNVS